VLNCRHYRAKAGSLLYLLYQVVRLLAESYAGEFFLEALALCGICGCGELVRQGEKSLLLSVFELKACFEQIDENAVGAGLVRFGHCAYAFGDSCGDCDA